MSAVPNVAALVLAGGRGKRLGTTKADLVVGYERERPVTMLDAVVRQLRRVTDDIVVVGGTDPQLDGVRWTADRMSGMGPLGGLEAGLEETARSAAVVVGCDMPYLEPAVLRLLARKVMRFGSRPAAVVPRTRLGMEPLCAAYTRGCAEVIRGLLREGKMPVRRVSDLLSAVSVDFVDEAELVQFGRPEDLFFNVNTPEDLRAARERWLATMVRHGTCVRGDDAV